MIKSKLRNKPSIINLIDFYLPLRGDLRKKHHHHDQHKSNTSSTSTPEEDAKIEKEIIEINKHYDFDVPSAIDWELLIVSITLY